MKKTIIQYRYQIAVVIAIILFARVFSILPEARREREAAYKEKRVRVLFWNGQEDTLKVKAMSDNHIYLLHNGTLGVEGTGLVASYVRSYEIIK